MARFRKHRRSRMFRSMSRSFRSSRKPSISAMDVLLAGAIYGVARPTIANAIPTFFSFGSIDSDNVILGGAGYFLSKSSNKLMKSLGLVAMGTEAGIVVSGIVTGSGNKSTTDTVYDY